MKRGVFQTIFNTSAHPVRRAFRVFLLILFLYFCFCVPSSLFRNPHSTVVYARNGELLSAITASDGQWRFPQGKEVPEKFRKSLLVFEDNNFYDHSGVYLPSVFRAMISNVAAGRIVSGGSTITMQTIRMGSNNPPRTLAGKLREMVMALRLEWSYSKDEILGLYTANAPFGGNVVGLEAASWRYFGRSPDRLSWAESATLAVLPNAPSLIFPGKNQDRLLQKRNRVLTMLFEAGELDKTDYELSLMEPLPDKPHALPQKAPHVLDRMLVAKGRGQAFTTTVDYYLQEQAAVLLERHMQQLRSNLIFNGAVLVVDVKTGGALVYLGNSSERSPAHGNHVDIINSPRSTGSILKPFLYAAMLKEGAMLPNTLLPDIPIQYNGFAPKNYTESYDGAVPAGLALSRSLNIPAVAMLKEYSYQRFYDLLRKMKFTHFTKPSDHYGLSIILGGGEASLWEITHAYADMARILRNYSESGGKYFAGNSDKRFLDLSEQQVNAQTEQNEDAFPMFDAGVIWSTYKSLLEVNRPESELGWEVYNSSRPIAWKTGTSFGNRDAWAVGTTPEYVVGVWVGNSDGQGRPLLTGVNSAAPLMFDVFGLLQSRSWFMTPYDNLQKISVCHKSGMIPGPYCDLVDSVYVPLAGTRSGICSFHKLIHTDPQGKYRINMSCSHGVQPVPGNWFVLPPVQAHYYRKKHPEYVELPPFDPNCLPEDYQPIGMIYPRSDAKIYVPKNITGKSEKVVLQASHQQENAVLFWHMDDVYLGETRLIHHMEVLPAPGPHKLTIVDDAGHVYSRNIEVVAKDR